MVPPADTAQTSAERIVSGTIVSSWWLWLVGGLYIAAPVIGWTLAGMVLWRYYIASTLPEEERPPAIGWPIRIWLIAMTAMLVILWVGHSQFHLGTGQTIKSSIGWAKGWALIALFPLAGAVLPIRLAVLSRAVCRLGKQTLYTLPIFIMAPALGLPQELWVSPLKVLGGAGDEYFAVILYTLEPGVGTARWQFFAPWAPAAGFVAVIHMLLALEERDMKWRIIGLAGGLSMALLSQSRLALVALAVVWPLAWLVSRFHQGWAWFIATPTLLAASWVAPTLIAFAEKAQSDFSGARADSSRVRATLGRIAVERWQNEAYWFGHGIVERGPHLVEYMPIGSHHSWYGLLYVKGLLGLLSLAIPLVTSLLMSARAAISSLEGRVGFAMALIYLLYSFGENLEVLVYLGWPALLAMGIALRKQKPHSKPSA